MITKEQLSPLQLDELSALKQATDVLVNNGGSRECIVERWGDVTLNEDAIELMQDVRSPIPNHPSMQPEATVVAPASLDELVDGTWFRKNIVVGENAQTETSLRVQVPYRIDNGGSTWFIPSLGNPRKNISNNRLIDPSKKEVVPFDDPKYEKRWNKITSWILDRLDESSTITLSEARFTNSPDERYSFEPLAKIGSQCLLEVVRQNYVHGAVEKGSGFDFSNSYTHILITEEENNQTTFKAWLDFNEHFVLLTDLGLYQPGVLHEQLNPYDVSPTLVTDLTKLAIRAQENTTL